MVCLDLMICNVCSFNKISFLKLERQLSSYECGNVRYALLQRQGYNSFKKHASFTYCVPEYVLSMIVL